MYATVLALQAQTDGSTALTMTLLCHPVYGHYWHSGRNGGPINNSLRES